MVAIPGHPLVAPTVLASRILLYSLRAPCRQSYPGVAEAAVVAIPDERWGERPLLVLVPRPGVEPGAELKDGVTKFLEQRLAKWVVHRVLSIVHVGVWLEAARWAPTRVCKHLEQGMDKVQVGCACVVSVVVRRRGEKGLHAARTPGSVRVRCVARLFPAGAAAVAAAAAARRGAGINTCVLSVPPLEARFFSHRTSHRPPWLTSHLPLPQVRRSGRRCVRAADPPQRHRQGV